MQIATKITTGIAVQAISNPEWCVVLEGVGFLLSRKRQHVYSNSAKTKIVIRVIMISKMS